MKYKVEPTSNEKVMRENDFIVSKTDLKGRITYGNEIFIEFSGYSEAELLGAQHSIIRHPDMPRGVFKSSGTTSPPATGSSPTSKHGEGRQLLLGLRQRRRTTMRAATSSATSVRRAPKRSALPVIEGLTRRC